MEKTDSHEYGTDFSRTIEKRVKKDVRLGGLLKKAKTILVKDGISEHFVKIISEGKPVKIIREGKADKTVMLWTIDDEINNFFMKVLGKTKKKEDFVKIFLSVTDEELEKYCKLNKIKFTRREKDKAVQKFVDELTAKHPDSKHKAIKSLERLGLL